MNILTFGGTSGIGRACQTDPAFAIDDMNVTGADVRSFAEVSTALNQFQPDGVIYCAGINRLDWIADMSIEQISDIMNVNAIGFMRVMKWIACNSQPVELEDGSMRQGVRSVVVVTSDAAERPLRTSMAYCASKAALNQAVRCAARELAPWCRVNGVAPGMTDRTEMTKYIDKRVPEIRGWTPEEALAYENSQSPMGRRANKWEIAEVIANVMHGPEYWTGDIVTVNGGR